VNTPEPSEVLARLEMAKGRHAERFLLTEDRLVEDSRIGERRWQRSWRLQDLSSELEYTSGRPEHTEARVVGGLVVLSLAATLYFSALHAHIPLFAPLLGALAAWLLVKGLRDWRIETWTLIKRSDGGGATHILHRLGAPEGRRDFEARLVEQIRRQHRLGS
jgi:hypothetical protein